MGQEASRNAEERERRAQGGKAGRSGGLPGRFRATKGQWEPAWSYRLLAFRGDPLFKGEFLFLHFGHAFAGGGVTRLEDDTKKDRDWSGVCAGEGEFERALFKQVNCRWGEVVFAESGPIDDV